MANSVEMRNIRKCLLIGNENYRRGNRLKYVLNNINDLQIKLQKYSFEITIGKDLLYEDFHLLIEHFIQQIYENDLILFIYCGYSIHLNNDNYLIPIDNQMIDNDQMFNDNCIHLQRIVQMINEKRPSSSIYLFDSSYSYIIINQLTSERSIDYGGLAPMKELVNCLIMYCCDSLKIIKEKSLNGRNTILISYFLEYVDQINIPIDQLIELIYDQIVHQSDHQIIPFKISSIKKKIYFNQQIYQELGERRSLFVEDLINKSENNSFIDLRSKGLIDRDMKIIVEEILMKKQIKRLWLNENQFTHIGASILSTALNLNHHLERLYLHGNSISDIGVKYISKALSNSNKTLKILDLQKNRITDLGIEYLSSMICVNKTLISLSLDFNLFTDKSMKVLSNSLINSNSSIEYLGLSNNQFLTDLSFDYLSHLIKLTKSINEITLYHCSFSRLIKEKLKKLSKDKKHFSIYLNNWNE